MAVVGVPLGIPICHGPVIPVPETEFPIVLLPQRNTPWAVFRKRLFLRALDGLWHEEQFLGYHSALRNSPSLYLIICNNLEGSLVVLRIREGLAIQ